MIDVEGRVIALQVEPSRSVARGDLVQAAIQAVRQWRYRPTLLNGQPIEVSTTISVTFSLVD